VSHLNSRVTCVNFGVICLNSGVTCLNYGVTCLNSGVTCLNYGVICLNSSVTSKFRCHVSKFRRHMSKFWCHIFILVSRISIPVYTFKRHCKIHSTILRDLGYDNAEFLTEIVVYKACCMEPDLTNMPISNQLSGHGVQVK